MNNAVIYVTRVDLEKIQEEGSIEILIGEEIKKGEWLRIELEGDIDE